MVTLALLLSSAALLTWPGAGGEHRLRNRHRASLARAVRHRRVKVLGALVAVPATVLLLGPAGPAAVALLGGAWWWSRQSAARVRSELRATADLAEAVRTMAGELAAGVDPETAAERAAVDSPPKTAAELRAVSGAVKYGGEQPPGVLARAWFLAQRHGLPMAGVLTAVRRDLDSAVRFARRTQARMSGAKASAVTLSFIPVLGIGVGEMMGAEPLRVLTATVAGQVLLVLGAGLMAAGVAWTARLTRVTR